LNNGPYEWKYYSVPITIPKAEIDDLKGYEKVKKHLMDDLQNYHDMFINLLEEVVFDDE
jgi:hypothetical protein|tara:strand:+ start:1641 stop:1817 length:177 start_codon:yes stop_codon:yes gene_type:complete